jgi:lipopolysaccharide export system protein LptA
MSRHSSDRKAGHTLAGAYVLLLLLMLPALSAQALPDDRDQPIHIAADKALRDEKQGITVYTGNVRMSQGSMELEADKLTIYQIEDDADKIVAQGNPAKMRQQPEADESLVHAHALVITYLRTKDMVHLQDNARIEQAGNLVTGESIDYFIAKQLIKAESGESEKSEQVRVTLIPENAQKEVTPSDTEETTPVQEVLEDSTVAADTPSTDAPVEPQQEAPAASENQKEDSASGTTESK